MADIENISEDSTSQTAIAGESLQKAREAKNMSVEEAARQLRLSTHQILAIEQDDFAKLPDAMIARGFIRNYAKLLDVDSAPLLLAFKTKMPDVGLAKLSLTSERIVIQSYHKKSYLNYIIASLVLLLGIAAWWFYMNQNSVVTQSTADQTLGEHSADGVTLTDENGHVIASEPLPPQALPAAERLAEASSLESTPNLGETPAVPSTQITVPASALPAPALPAPSAPLIATPTVSSLPAAEDTASVTASLKASEETWVQVLNMSGSVIYERTISAGTSDRFAFKPPVKIVVGNASGTQLIYKNQPVDLLSRAKNNVARLTLE